MHPRGSATGRSYSWPRACRDPGGWAQTGCSHHLPASYSRHQRTLRAGDGCHRAAGWPWREPCTQTESPLWPQVCGEPAVLGLALLQPSRHFSALPLRASHTGQQGAGAVRAPRPFPSERRGLVGTRRRLPAPRHRTPGAEGTAGTPRAGEEKRLRPTRPLGTTGRTGRPGRRQHSRRGEPSPSLLEKVWTELRGQGSPPSPAHPPPVVLPGHPHARAAGSRVRAAPPPLPDRFIALKKESSGPPLPAPRPPPRLGLM